MERGSDALMEPGGVLEEEDTGIFAETLKSGVRWVFQWEAGAWRMGPWVGLDKAKSLRVKAPERPQGLRLCESLCHIFLPQSTKQSLWAT